MSNRPTYTVRVTQLEAFRFWMFGQTEDNEAWNTEAKVIDTLSGEYVANFKADYGSAGHLIIEKPYANRTDTGYKIKKLTFTDSQVIPLLRYAQAHPYMIREVAISKLYVLPEFDLIITGTVDALEGCFIRDNKFKFSSFDVQEYKDSVQHRLYMHMLGMKWFYYDFFRVKGFEYPQDCVKAVISEVEEMLEPWNDGMEAEINSLLTEFADWVKFKGLMKYLAITPEKAVKIVQGNSQLKSLIV